MQEAAVRYIDIHSHFNLPQFDVDREAAMRRMREEGVATITVGVNRETSQRAVALAREHDGVWATVGQHPTETAEHFDSSALRALLYPKVVAVGECGLDYFRIENQESRSKEEQKRLFIQQVEFALEHNLPLMLHCRPSKGTMDAYEDLLSILDPYFKVHNSKLCGNVHFFVGNLEIAKKFWDRGFTVSFPGVITFARDYDEVVRSAPADMILSETDAPFAAPVLHRGKRNEPAYVREVVARIAQIRGEDSETVAARIWENARRVFALE